MRLHTHTLAILLSLAFGACGKEGPPPSRPAARDFSRNPPGVENATIRPLAQPQANGNAILEVSFEEGDSSVLDGVRIYPRGKEIVLRDDGSNGDSTAHDGVFSALVDFDFPALSTQVARGAKLMTNATPQVIFAGREAIGIEDPEMVRERLNRFIGLRDVDALRRMEKRFNLVDLVSAVDPMSIDPARALMVTAGEVRSDPLRTVNRCGLGGVTGNPDGVWTFKHLVTEMVGSTGVDPATLVENWLLKWGASQTVSSGFAAAPRPEIQTEVLTPWPRTAAGTLDLNKSPFRLAAIVNRIDLGSNPAYGGPAGAGEVRFIFAVFDHNCHPLPFSVIFEYGVPKHTCPDVQAWAQRWVALPSILSTDFAPQLEAITEEVVRANADPSKPNGSALNQLRTNQITLPLPWELREFTLNATTHLFDEVTTKQTPDVSLNGTTTLRDYVNQNATLIKHDRHVVPDHFPGATDPFMAAASQAFAGALSVQGTTHFASAGITDNDARFHFSFNTCSACHMRETGTPFFHVDPEFGPIALSHFLTGNTASLTDSPDLFQVSDPVNSATKHPFNDLDRRRKKLAAIAGSSCFSFLPVPPRRLFEQLGPPPARGRLPTIRDPRLNGLNDPLRMTH